MIPSEIRRFEELVTIKYDATQPWEARIKAASELVWWIHRKPRELVRAALTSIINSTGRSLDLWAEATCAWCYLEYQPGSQLVCVVFRGLRILPGDEAACSQCGKRVDSEAHGAGPDYPGVYCRACCPACGLIPREHLKVAAATVELEIEMQVHGWAYTEPLAREISWMISSS